MARASIKGDGTIYQRSDGLYVAALDLGYGPDGKRRRWTGASRTREGALAKLRKARGERDTTGVVLRDSTTVGQWLDEWLTDIARPRVRPKTYLDYERCIRLHLKPRLGAVKLTALTPQHIRRVEQAIAKERTPATAKSVHICLHAALNDAVLDGRVVRNAALSVTPPKVSRVEREPLSTADARQIIAASSGDEFGSRWHFALMTGCRAGETLGLEWDRVDLDRGTADVSWQVQRLPYEHGCGNTPCGRKRGGNCPDRHLQVPEGFEMRAIPGSALVLTRPKTDRSVRMIPLEPGLVAALREHRRNHPRISGFVWAQADGSPIDPKDDDLAWDQLLDGLEIPRVRRHDVRHTTASLLMEMGVDAKVIQELMGHTSVETTRGYQHANLDMMRAAVGGLGEALA